MKEVSKSYSKNNKFEEYKVCSDGEKNQEECDKCKLRSQNHEMNLQKKSTLSHLDDERCYINFFESVPWKNYYLLVVKVIDNSENTKHVNRKKNVRYYDGILSI